MTQGLALRSPQPDSYAKVEPCLRLLVEPEPGYRVFFRNLFDLILRSEPVLFLASQPAPCRRHFYVRTGVRWPVLVESMAWHLAVAPLLLVLWTVSPQWDSARFPLRQARMTQSHYQLTYYAPEEKFPARQGRQHEEPTHQPAAEPTQPGMHVAVERERLEVEAPQVTASGSMRAAEFAPSAPTLPAVPLSATARSQLVLPADFSEVIGPAPSAGHLSLRAFGAPGAAVVGPAPQVTAGLRRGGGVTLPAAVAAPAPALQGAVRGHLKGSFDTGSAAVVAPSPDLGEGGAAGVPARGQGFGTGIGVLAAAVVPPPPSIRGRVFVPGGSGASGGGAGPQVVAPSPALSHGLVLAGGRGNSLASAGTQVVPPSPALRGRSFRSGGAGGSGIGNGVQVVGPAPSLGLAGVRARGRGNSVGGIGTQVIAPAPSIAGRGKLGGGTSAFGVIGGSAVGPAPSVGRIPVYGGNGSGTGVGTLTGAGAQVVAPTPVIGSSRVGHGLGGDGGNSLASLGSEVLPPSIGTGGQGSGTGGANALSGAGSQGSAGSPQGVGGSGTGSGSSSSGAGTETVAGLAGGPATGIAGRGGQPSAPIMSAAIPKRPEIPDLPAGKTAVFPLRVVQLALALPMSSYFSNYEAFLAERSVSRDTSQLIKLVYIFLPYQRRLTEVGVNTSKTFNLRVTRDPSCDESLISMTWPEGETQGKPAEYDKQKLPCYRTTADDYRRAWEKAR